MTGARASGARERLVLDDDASTSGSDGVEENDAVITAEGLVGRVSDVTRRRCDVVTLITDDERRHRPGRPGRPEGSIVPIIGAPGNARLHPTRATRRSRTATSWSPPGSAAARLAPPPAGIPVGEVSEAIPAEQEQQRGHRRARTPTSPTSTVQVTVLTAGRAW